MEEIVALISGTLYGLLIGIIPSVGATTGLVTLFAAIGWFADPYLAVIFLMAVVAASTTGDTFACILLGIPGANSSAATMVDGFPLAKQGKATYAITAAITTSTINGLIWGTLTFALLPYYAKLIMVLGIPELWAFVVLAFTTVAFVSSSYWVRSLIAIALGIGLGVIGMDPITASDRFTMGWEYLGDGIQLMPLLAGVFAVPSLIDGFKNRAQTTVTTGQTLDGFKATFKYKWDALRGGLIGAFIGLLPGLGGAVSDWLSYGATVAAHPNEKFGNGNIRGVIGPEGSNNAQKATSMIPTVLFGIPGASFAAVLLALFMYLGFELGTPELSQDARFFSSMTIGFMGGTILVFLLSLILNKQIARIVNIPYKYFFSAILIVVIWACVQYTGGWEDYVMLLLCSILGIFLKRYKYSRPALVIGFILAERIESLTIQMSQLYNINSLIGRPIFLILLLVIVAIATFGILNKSKMGYT